VLVLHHHTVFRLLSVTVRSRLIQGGASWQEPRPRRLLGHSRYWAIQL